MKTMGDVVADPIEEESSGEGGTAQNPSGGKEFGQRTLRSLKKGLGRLWRRHRGNASITEYDPCYKVAYLGNVLTGWAKGERIKSFILPFFSSMIDQLRVIFLFFLFKPFQGLALQSLSNW